jgi:hypothetical protein
MCYINKKTKTVHDYIKKLKYHFRPCKFVIFLVLDPVKKDTETKTKKSQNYMDENDI